MPTCDSDDSKYNESFINFTIPYNDDENQYESCTYFYNSINQSSSDCSPENFDTSKTVNCFQWIYDDDLFKTTIIGDVII